ncbi:response regulator transcription factor [Ammoniphilus sp. CFH 90114]|uniref:response regulator transcription factor n=1 Tax=Ammoniphilus sp. CFH 90114 TaxID=2493665 RepID=UPI00100E3ED4|nr:response regulator transcription factor [Ammoniphilus sp. CFH 90114]RXT04537.1 response regulator transcription factor [Ammoniphilus sp. CFH 90114]
MIRILLVDDHPAIIHGTKTMLEKEHDFEIVSETCGEKAVKLVGQQEFDVLLLDLNMPDPNGITLSKEARKIKSDIVIVIYTGFDLEPELPILLESGVTGFVSKTAHPDQLVTAIRCAIRNETVLPVTTLRKLFQQQDSIQQENNGILEEFEIIILKELCTGRSNREISKSLLLGQRTFEYRLSQLFKKLEVSTKIEAIARANELGIRTR